MNYAELKKAYEESIQKCSELEKEIENKDLRIEHLTELLIKRNKMLFGQKSEKGKYICDGQLSLEGIVFNEAEEQICSICGEPLTEYTEEYITTRLAVIPEKVYQRED